MDVKQYPHYYYRLMMHWWDTMSPMDYGYLLVSIGVFGYLLMRSGSR